jgi:ABC-type multidrug transport system fused ATPase/permease subunit
VAARETEALLEASDEAVRHADLWVTYGAEEKVRANVAAVGAMMTRRAAKLEASAAALSGGNEVLGAFALVITMGAARAGWLGDGVGGLLAFAVAFFLAYRPLRDLADARLALTRAGGALERLLAVGVGEREGGGEEGGRVQEGEEERERERKGARQGIGGPREEQVDAGTWRAGSLELRELKVRRGALPAVDLSVRAGEIVAFAGPTGIGKTTLLRTLLGLERPLSGEIVFDGRPLRAGYIGPHARPFAWVPQEAPVLADTLEGNVGLGAPHDAATRDALEPLGAGHLLRALAGVRLGATRPVSGGERQWIALARAIATGLPVLLLDEPTSGLDPVSQERVLEAIARLRGQRTVLVVTHRPEPLAIADRVVRF